MRAHLRSCDDCATFERAMGARQADLHTLGPWLGGAGALGLLGLGGAGGAVAIKPPPRRPPPTAAKTPHQLALEQLQRIREQTLAAFLNAQWIAASGAPSGRQTANSTIQSALGSAQPRIERILASMGLSMPSRATTPSSWRSSPTMTNVGDPARSAGSTR